MWCDHLPARLYLDNAELLTTAPRTTYPGAKNRTGVRYSGPLELLVVDVIER